VTYRATGSQPPDTGRGVRGLCAQAGEHRNIQQIFPFAVEGVVAEDPRDDWATVTFITWVELMVRKHALRARTSNAAKALLSLPARALSLVHVCGVPHLVGVLCASQMLRHRRNQPPGYTDAVLDDVDAKAAEFVALLQAHWMEDQKSDWFTDKARLI
jgi:hypothetical protein